MAVSTRGSVTLNWLVNLRWFAVVAQFLLVLAIDVLAPVDAPLVTFAGLLGLVAVSNLALTWATRRGRAGLNWATAALAFDVGILTVALDQSGGPMNPFSFLYVVQVALAAVALRPWSVGLIALLSIAGYGALYVKGGHEHMHHSHAFMMLHLDGMWVAMAVTAAIIGYFISVLQSQLNRRDEELRRMRETATRHERLDTLTSLAASAAHELSTPLGTIAITAKELANELSKYDDPSLAQDAMVIREETRRCQEILKRLSMSSGDTLGEEMRTCESDEILGFALDKLHDTSFVDTAVESCSIRVPRAAVVESLSALIQNAIDAASESAEPRVTVRGRRDGEFCKLEIEDNGPGIARDDLTRVLEPFYTTKEKGMGLGLFIADRLFRELGGGLKVENRPEGGARVTITIPAVAS